jgi:sorbitol-specific phosphotransferase system component IIA
MDKESVISKITEIGTCEDEVRRRELLASFQDDVCKDYDEHASLKESNEELSKDNEKLRSANMKLFLRVGESKSPEDIAKQKGIDVPEEKLEFKDLFNEKGDLK